MLTRSAAAASRAAPSFGGQISHDEIAHMPFTAAGGLAECGRILTDSPRTIGTSGAISA